MLHCASELANDRISPTTPCLLAVYDSLPINPGALRPFSPAVEESNDHTSLALLDHRRGACPHCVPHPGEVDVDDRGGVIPGLYAAGNAAASVFGPAYPGGGATIGPAITFGYLAGRHAAAQPPRSVYGVSSLVGRCSGR